MFLDLEKLLVKRENLGRTFLSGGGKLILSVGQNLFEMSQRHFRILALRETKLNADHECHVERIETSQRLGCPRISEILRSAQMPTNENLMLRAVLVTQAACIGSRTSAAIRCSQLDRVTLQLVIKRWTLDAEKLRGLFLVAVALRRAPEESCSVRHRRGVCTPRSWQHAEFGLLQRGRQLHFRGQLFYADQVFSRQDYRVFHCVL